MAEPTHTLLALHYRQLRTTRGTVLLGPPSWAEGLRSDPAWFVDGCPLEPEAAVAAITARHGFADARAARAALHEAREALRRLGADEAESLGDLPDP